MDEHISFEERFVDESIQLLDGIDLALTMLSSGIKLSPTIRVIQNAVDSLQESDEVVGQKPLAHFSGAVSAWIDHRVESTDFARDQTLTVLKKSSEHMRCWLQACEQGKTPDDAYFEGMHELLESNKRRGT